MAMNISRKLVFLLIIFFDDELNICMCSSEE